MERTLAADEAASVCFVRLAAMSRRELEALAVYKTHKLCCCEDCQIARKALVEFDSKRWPKGD
jgi:hypothetical protein